MSKASRTMLPRVQKRLPPACPASEVMAGHVWRSFHSLSNRVEPLSERSANLARSGSTRARSPSSSK